MKKNISLIFILLTIFCFSIPVSGQDSTKIQPKNVIYADVGTLGLWFTASVNYERHLFSPGNKNITNYYLRASGGAYATWGADGPFASLSLQGILGPNKHHFEFGLGVGALYDIGITPTANIGYRYQKPNGGFVFRTGIGFPHGVNLSLGAAF